MSERVIRRLTVRIWPNGLDEEEAALALEHIAAQIRNGFIAGEVANEGGGGWWDTTAEGES